MDAYLVHKKSKSLMESQLNGILKRFDSKNSLYPDAKDQFLDLLKTYSNDGIISSIMLIQRKISECNDDDSTKIKYYYINYLFCLHYFEQFIQIYPINDFGNSENSEQCQRNLILICGEFCLAEGNQELFNKVIQNSTCVSLEFIDIYFNMRREQINIAINRVERSINSMFSSNGCKKGISRLMRNYGDTMSKLNEKKDKLLIFKLLLKITMNKFIENPFFVSIMCLKDLIIYHHLDAGEEGILGLYEGLMDLDNNINSNNNAEIHLDYDINEYI